jgi:hypothetical protein
LFIFSFFLFIYSHFPYCICNNYLKSLSINSSICGSSFLGCVCSCL